MRERTSICGLEFERDPKSRGQIAWGARRQFPHLPCNNSEPADVTILATPDQPSEAQTKALQGFLENEQATCESMLDATLRWCRYTYDEQPGFSYFRLIEQEPPRDVDELCGMVDFSFAFVMPLEHCGVALIGFGFGCDWDDEHGLGIVTHDGKTLHVGQQDEVASRCWTGIPDAICTAEELVAKTEVLAALLHMCPPIINPFTGESMPASSIMNNPFPPE